MQASRQYWHDVLATGGVTAVPRWSAEGPRDGSGTVVAQVPAEVAAALHRFAGEAGTDLTALVVAAHARVLAAVSGESQIVTGLALPGGPGPLPCRLGVTGRRWRDLVADTAVALAELRRHRDFPPAELAELAELGRGDDPLFETVLDLAGPTGQLPAGVVARIAVGRVGSGIELQLTHRHDALDGPAADRLLGYHLRALRLLGADPDADQGRAVLIDEAELREQLDGLAGPIRELPPRRVHELVEERARTHPDRVAVQAGDEQLTYRELDERADRIGRALLAAGLGREDVVAVVAERTPRWAAAVLAILKAGGTYLPIEPQFPPDRIATALSRSAARLVLAEPGSRHNLDPALEPLSGVEVLDLEPDDGGSAPTTQPGGLGVAVDADQLAYIFFTSGSTGTPKGAMCEHAGLLNHLLAKIEDFGLLDGAVVAQTAPQCFDISLWQLLASWLVGGRTVLVAQPEILDIARFVERIAADRVQVVQLVPSYLEVVLSHLDRHRPVLPDLRCVSVTGEALKKEIAQRWFARMPQVPLVNAYGLTETSDDTNHEVMHALPDTERVPLGRAVRNVRVLVVDEDLAVVPLGAPGEIVFSGVCVGRGYINDPDRTAEAFRSDPYHPGERLYRSGDRGRWLPGGTLDFLGRRDNQVKIRGFRIEIGDVEETLLRVPGVRDAAVVVRTAAGRPVGLAACYAGPAELPASALAERLARSLPEYMVPSAFHHRDALPLTANGKVDRRVLAELLAAVEEPAAAADPPKGPVERRLAEAWAGVLDLDVERVGRHDNFYELGGTSLSAVRLAISLDRALGLADITGHPQLADMAGVLAAGGRVGAPDRLLHRLSGAGGRTGAVLVCFPHAGGNAANYRAAAGALAGSGVEVHGVEPPGHDPVAAVRDFVDLATLAVGVADEVEELLRERGTVEILLWGQSSGTAAALATTRVLGERGIEVGRLFLGAQLPGRPVDRRSAAADLERLDDRALAERLRAADMFPELAGLEPAQIEWVAAAYRHDCVAAHRYFADTIDTAHGDPGHRPPAVPVTAVLAADDESTALRPGAHRDWAPLAGPVELVELADGGHHFLRTRPEAVAAVVAAVAAAGPRPVLRPTPA